MIDPFNDNEWQDTWQGRTRALLMLTRSPWLAVSAVCGDPGFLTSRLRLGDGEGYWVTSNGPSKVNEVSLNTRDLARTDLWDWRRSNISGDQQVRQRSVSRAQSWVARLWIMLTFVCCIDKKFRPAPPTTHHQGYVIVKWGDWRWSRPRSVLCLQGNRCVCMRGI